MRLRALFLTLTLGIAVSSSFLTAAAEAGFRTGIGNTNQVFTEIEEATDGGSFDLTISQGQPARIRVDLVDIFATELGAKQFAPLKSTPYTPFNYVEFTQDAGTYIPNGQTQTIKIPFKFKRIVGLDRPIIGGLRISLQEIPTNTANSNPEIKINTGIVGTFAFYPIGLVNQGEYKILPKLKIRKIKVRSISQDMFPLNLIPNFPALINKGPIQLTTEIYNEGNIFLETLSEAKINQAGLFAQNKETDLFRNQTSKSLLTPGQLVSNTVNVNRQIVGSEALINPLPTFGILKVSVSTTGSIGSKEFVSSSKTKFFIIFPWKITLILVLVLIATTIYRRRFRAKRNNSNSTIAAGSAHLVDLYVKKFMQEIDNSLQPAGSDFGSNIDVSKNNNRIDS